LCHADKKKINKPNAPAIMWRAKMHIHSFTLCTINIHNKKELLQDTIMKDSLGPKSDRVHANNVSNQRELRRWAILLEE
jgi:hypothetical protein